MASERDKAKGDIEAKSQDDAELDAALDKAHNYQLKLVQEKNRHAERTQKNNLGALGVVFGGEKSAPLYIALVVVVAGIAGAAVCWSMASGAPGSQDFWSTQAERSIAFASAALAFIFGRGTKP